MARRPGVRGVFGWSFYADPSAEHWAEALLEWARQDLGVAVAGTGGLAGAVLGLLRVVPLLLVLDGLEVAQEGPAGDGFGRLLDGTLREVLAGACQQPHGGLVVLTSRFPFADLEGFDGGSARMLEVPPFTAAEGSALLAAAGGGWLAEDERRALVRGGGRARAGDRGAGRAAGRPPARCRPGRPARRAGRGGAHRCPGGQGAGVLRRPAGRGGPVPAGRGVAVRPAGPGARRCWRWPP